MLLVQTIPATGASGFSSEGDWSRSGNTLTITSQGQNQDYVIEEISDSRLWLSAEASTVVQQNGSTSTTSLELDLIFTK